MSFPEYILGLYGGALLVSLAVLAWATAHRPLLAEGRRVTDAAERAGLLVLAVPARVALGSLALVLALSAFWAHSTGAPVGWFVGAPLAAALLTFALSQASARMALRTACRLLSAEGRNVSSELLGRTALAATLWPVGASGLLIVGTFSIAERGLGPNLAARLAGFTCAAVAIFVVVQGRTSAALLASSLVTESRSRRVNDGAHPATLAEVVALTFGRATLLSSAFFLLLTLGHWITLLRTIDLRQEVGSAVWLYPHALPALALVALLFGGLVVKSDETETSPWAFRRAALVMLVLVLAGAWSLAQSIDDGLHSRLLPAGVSFFVIGVGLFLALTSFRPKNTASGERASFLRLGAFAWAALLVLLLVGAIHGTTEKSLLSEELLEAVLLGTTLCLLPILYFLRFARDIAKAARASASLVGDVHHRRPPDLLESGVSEDVTPVFWVLAALVGLLSAGVAVPRENTLLLVGTAAIFGAALLHITSTQSAASAWPFRKRTIALVESHGEAANGEALRLTEALDIAEESTRRGNLLAPAFGFALPLTIVLVAKVWPFFPTTALTFGLSLGVLLFGGGLAAFLEEREPDSQSGHTVFAFTLALSVVTFMTLGQVTTSP